MKHELVEYDADSDALYVTLLDSDVARTHALDDLRLIDYSSDGGVVGVEFLEASHGIDLSDVPFGHRIEDLIRQNGLHFPSLV